MCCWCACVCFFFCRRCTIMSQQLSSDTHTQKKQTNWLSGLSRFLRLSHLRFRIKDGAFQATEKVMNSENLSMKDRTLAQLLRVWSGAEGFGVGEERKLPSSFLLFRNCAPESSIFLFSVICNCRRCFVLFHLNGREISASPIPKQMSPTGLHAICYYPYEHLCHAGSLTNTLPPPAEAPTE